MKHFQIRLEDEDYERFVKYRRSLGIDSNQEAAERMVREWSTIPPLTENLSKETETKVNRVPELEVREKLSDILHPEHIITSDLSDAEWGFLGECLQVYRSRFGNALRENVKWFGIGMLAVARLERLEASDEHAGGNAETPGAIEQRVDGLLDIKENEADLLRKEIIDAGKKLPGDGGIDSGSAGGNQTRRKRDPRKTGSGS